MDRPRMPNPNRKRPHPPLACFEHWPWSQWCWIWRSQRISTWNCWRTIWSACRGARCCGTDCSCPVQSTRPVRGRRRRRSEWLHRSTLANRSTWTGSASGSTWCQSKRHPASVLGSAKWTDTRTGRWLWSKQSRGARGFVVIYLLGQPSSCPGPWWHTYLSSPLDTLEDGKVASHPGDEQCQCQRPTNHAKLVHAASDLKNIVPASLVWFRKKSFVMHFTILTLTPNTLWQDWCRGKYWFCMWNHWFPVRGSTSSPHRLNRTRIDSGQCSTNCSKCSRGPYRRWTPRSSTLPRRARRCSRCWARRPWQLLHSQHLEHPKKIKQTQQFALFLLHHFAHTPLTFENGTYSPHSQSTNAQMLTEWGLQKEGRYARKDQATQIGDQECTCPKGGGKKSEISVRKLSIPILISG